MNNVVKAALASIAILGFNSAATAQTPLAEQDDYYHSNPYLHRVTLQTCSADGYTISGRFMIIPSVPDVARLGEDYNYGVALSHIADNLVDLWSDKTEQINIEDILIEASEYPEVNTALYINSQLSYEIQKHLLKDLRDQVEADLNISILTDPEGFQIIDTPDANAQCQNEEGVTNVRPIRIIRRSIDLNDLEI